VANASETGNGGCQEEGHREDVVILVDPDDQAIGTEEKAACHRHPVPMHRAFSIFLYDDRGRMLITKRSAEKPTWPGYWSNACCSHPRPGEATEDAAHRRLAEELGVSVSALTHRFAFAYDARYDDTWGEHELDHVFTGSFDGALDPDPAEIEAWELIELPELERRLVENAGHFTPWFCIACARLHANAE